MEYYEDKYQMFPLGENEKLSDDGNTIYCTKCGKPTHIRNSFMLFNECDCDCTAETTKKLKEKFEYEQKMAEIEKLKMSSFMSERYKNVSFDDIEIYNNEHKVMIERVKKYCELFKEQNNGEGLYIFGSCGSGKTMLTACMANYLIQQGVACMFTNIEKIKQKLVQLDFTEKNDFLKSLYEIDVLFLDDFGTERFVKNSDNTWSQDVVYDIINERYNKLKPIIFTSNNSLKDLVETIGVMEKTVDRIYETCVPMKLDVPNHRHTNNKSYF